VVATHGSGVAPAHDDVSPIRQELTVHHLHPYTLRELELLRAASETRRRPARSRPAPWRRRVRARLRERAELTVFTVDADEITAQLAHDGAR
jgi:hypothetical protein